MASYLRPRRGSYNNAKSQLTASNPLKSGEVFFECENIGKSQGKIKLGDATTTYSSLPYFLSMQDSSIGFTDVTGSNSTAESTILGNIKPSGTHSSVITNIKQLLWNHSKKIQVHYGLIEESLNAISVINTRVTTLEESSGSIFIPIQKIREKKFVVIGDSWGEGAIYISPGEYTRNISDGWIIKFKNELNIPTNNFIYSAYGGGGFVARSSAGTFTDIFNNISLSNPETVDYVIVMGGTNDYNQNQSDVYSGIANFCNAVRNKCPNATIMIGMCGIQRFGTTISKMINMLQYYTFGAINNGAVYIRGIENICKHSAFIGGDGLHMTADGYTYLAKCLAQFMVSTNINYHAASICTTTPPSGRTFSGTITTGIDNDVAYLYVDDCIYEKGSGDNLTFYRNGTWNGIVNINETDILGRTDIATLGVPTKTTCIFQVPGNTFEIREVDVRISGGSLQIRWFELNDSKTGFKDALIAYNCQIKRFMIVTPTYEGI